MLPYIAYMDPMGYIYTYIYIYYNNDNDNNVVKTIINNPPNHHKEVV